MVINTWTSYLGILPGFITTYYYKCLGFILYGEIPRSKKKKDNNARRTLCKYVQYKHICKSFVLRIVFCRGDEEVPT